MLENGHMTAFAETFYQVSVKLSLELNVKETHGFSAEKGGQ